MDWGKVDINSNYKQPSKLGVDRWASLIALAALGPPNVPTVKNLKEVILVSAGTATVIDRFFWKRQTSKYWLCKHKGGIIFPGFNKMSLDMNFVKKSSNQRKSSLVNHPNNTLDAIKTGVASCQVLFGRKKNQTIVVHGGDSKKWIESYVFFNPKNSKPIELPWLVFEGIYIINQKNMQII
jgi:pantothenate kinase type III